MFSEISYPQLSRISIFNKFAPVQILALGFALLILIGALILMLPVSSAEGVWTPFLTALFTATSAVCVTGLVIVDTGTYWSFFGQIVIICLIQIGGIGFMSMATLMALVFGKKITLRERLVIQEALNTFSLQGLVKLMRYVLIGTFTIEAVGAILLSIGFVPIYGFNKGIYFGIFHAISAFCNAGFDLIGGFQSLVPFQENVIICGTVMLLIVIGGLGFIIHSEVYNHRDFKKFSLHSKVAILTTLILIFSGAVLFFVLEYNNPGTMKPLSFKGKVLSSFFASITPRTAGFNSVDTVAMNMPSKLLTIVLMFIGASPGSTGGGIKTTTAALLIMTVIAVLKGRSDTEIFEKRIPREIVYRAISTGILSLTLIVIDVLILSMTENGAKFEELVYEATSAFGTVGLTLGYTPKLGAIGKVIILLTMYAGRVGPLTLALAFAQKQMKNNGAIKYPEDKIIVG